MTGSGLTLSLLFMAGVWPFGSDEPNGEPTIGSLGDKEIEVSPSMPVEDAAARARENYREFLKLSSRDVSLSAEAMRRLADMELEATELAELAENIDSIDGSRYDSAISLYSQLLSTYPDYARNDVVRYQLARAYESSGQPERALESLDQVVKEYPDTALVDEVQFRRGEMLFVVRQYGPAEEAYAAVAALGPDSLFYEQSLYKLGWSQFKQSSHLESLAAFFELLKRKLPEDSDATSGDLLAQLSRPERELVEDTFRVLSISFSYMEGHESIDEYLAANGAPAFAFVIYRNLGDLYMTKERYVDAAETYRAFVDGNPEHFRAPLLQVEVIEAYREGGFPSEVLRAKADYVERYGMDSVFWQNRSRKQHPQVVEHLKSNLDDLARYYHAEGQKTGDPEAYETAARRYRQYLDYFPGEPDTADTNFLLAEILFELKDYEDATEEYERTAYSYPAHARGAEAGYAALLGYRRQAEQLKGTESEAQWHQRYLDSGLKFAETYPEHPESSAVLATIAEALFAQDEYEQAIGVARRVVERQPPADAALVRTAWTVVAHSHFDLEQFDLAEQAYVSLRALVPDDDTERQNEIRERIASSIYKQAEQARETGDLRAAVSNFSRVADVVPDSSIGETADYDATAALIALEDWDSAALRLEQFRETYPDSKFVDDVAQKLAVVYVKGGQSQLAAGEFERIADNPDTSAELQREALMQAADLYKESANAGREAQLLEKFVKRFPTPVSESIEARLRLADIAADDTEARRRRLRDIIAADAAAGGERTNRTRYLAAVASLELIEPRYERFKALRLEIPLKESLAIKKAAMEELLKDYGKAADYGVAEVTTAATFQLGEVYRQFSADLMDSERPDGLDADGLEQYEILLEEQAFPFEEKAIELYQANTRRAADGIYDEWVKKSYDELAELLPARYAKAERGEDAVSLRY